MKWKIAMYVAECDTYRRVKADHLRTTGSLQPLSVPEWKWEDICMDFIVGLPHTSRGHDSIWVIVDRLTKLAQFILVGTRYRARQYAELFIAHIVRYHGILRTIISDGGSIFVARFCEQLHECLGTHLIRSLAYCLHGNLIAHMERDRTLSHKVSPDASLFKATKGNESN
jgi:hypothetical protein